MTDPYKEAVANAETAAADYNRVAAAIPDDVVLGVADLHFAHSPDGSVHVTPPREDLSGFEAGHDRALTGPELMAENAKLREKVKRLRHAADVNVLFGEPSPAVYVVNPGDELEDATGTDVYRVLNADGDVARLIVVREDLEVGDRHHTIPELYDHRRKLTAVLATIGAINGDSWRSKLHHPGDGPMFDGSFIVGIDLPGGTITYHYPLDSWDEFAAVPELEHAPKWDGAGPADTLTRLAAFTAHLKQAIDDGRMVQEQARAAADAVVEAAEQVQ